jgi:peptide/nickel transport system permease protein
MLPFVVLGVVTLVFFIMRVIPSDVARLVAGVDATPQQVETVRSQLGLDRPVWSQYGAYLGEVVRGDLGRSIYSRRPVAPEIWDKFRNTALLTVTSMAIAVTLGLTLGVVAASKPHSLWDNVASVISAGGLAMPRFWLGLMLILIFAERLRWFPARGGTDPYYLILPALSLAIPASATIARMTRATLLDVLHEDFIRTARAKGLREHAVTIRHALKPALLPVVTVVGLQLGFMLGGSVIVETVFAYPGVGSLVVRAIQTRDYPIVQGGVVFIALSFAAINLLVDLSYGWLDPRIRHA